MPLLLPKRVKYRKTFKGRMRGAAVRNGNIAFGSFAMKSEEPGWISSRQIESARRAMSRYTQRGGRIWIRIFPDKPITKHPAESRMGGGKGELQGYVAVIRPGNILFEMGAVTEEVAKEAMRLASHKLPLKTRFITKETEHTA